MRTNYEERRQARLDRYRELAEKNREQSSATYKLFQDHLHAIPLGQPILIGHHSERGHRAHLKRTDRLMGRFIEEGKKADYYEQRAATVESNRAISSDDPEAIAKLKAKIERAEQCHETMKRANVLIRRMRDRPAACTLALVAEGFPEETAAKLLKPDFAGRVGFADYKLQNNNSNIRRMKQRLEQLQRLETMENREETIGDVRIVDNAEANRVQVFFTGKPSESVRSYLKANGFRWCRTEGAWQRHLSRGAHHCAEEAAKLTTTTREAR